MNYQEVERANGQLIRMIGMITEFKGEGVNQKSNKPWKKVVIQDTEGKKHNVTLRGTLPDVGVLNMAQAFNLSTYTSTHDKKPYLGFSGFWDGASEVKGQGGSSGYGVEPTRPTVDTSRPTQNGDKEMRIVRGNACNAVFSAAEIPIDEIDVYLLATVRFILTGTWGLERPIEVQTDEPDDDEMPF